jgi:hypothetical protein
MKSLIIASMLFVPVLPLFAQGQVTMIEANRITTQNDGAILLPSLPASPILDATSGAPSLFQPSQFQSSSLSIQAVPEPSSLALCGMSVGLALIVFTSRRKEDKKQN